MKIHEYQGKQIFAKAGMPVQDGYVFDKIEDAVIRFMEFSATKNGKSLNKTSGISEEQIEHIRPIFLCIMQYFDLIFRDIFFGGNNLSTAQPEIKSKDIREQIIKNSPQDNEDYFVVPKVIE